MKLTKRKAFKFFRSYYDVYNELQTDKDKVAFINALLDKQFLGKDPDNLKGLSKFAYISQINSIDSQVAGYETKTGTSLGATQGGAIGATVQEEEEVQEKEQYVIDWDSLIIFINTKTGRKFKVMNSKVKASFIARLKDGYSKTDIINAIINSTETKYHKESNNQYLTPEFFSRANTIDKYSYTPKQVSKVDKVNNFINNF